MAYSAEVFNIATDRLDDRRMAAESSAKYRKEQAYQLRPQLKEIDRKLAEIGASAAVAAIRSGNAAKAVEELAQQSLSLQEEYERLLAEINLNAKALEPAYKCIECCDTGYIELDGRTVICDCMKKLMSEISCEKLNAESPLKLSTFESFKLEYYSDRPDAKGSIPRNRMTKIFNYCRDYAYDFGLGSRCVLMRGATGLGKTHLSLAIANEVIRKGYTVVYVSAPDILSKLEREHFTYKYDSEADTFDSLIRCDLLIVDDLGTEFMSQFSRSTFYNIFNSRILAGKPVIISTNLTSEEMAETYSKRLLSRIMGSGDILDFTGEDVRKRL